MNATASVHFIRFSMYLCVSSPPSTPLLCLFRTSLFFSCCLLRPGAPPFSALNRLHLRTAVVCKLLVVLHWHNSVYLLSHALTILSSLGLGQRGLDLVLVLGLRKTQPAVSTGVWSGRVQVDENLWVALVPVLVTIADGYICVF